MSKLYIIGKVITLPGAYLKAFWEHLIYKILRIPVDSNAYLNFDEGLGHVEHALTHSIFRLFFANFLPGLFNFVLGLPMFAAGVLGLAYLGVEPVIRETGAKTWIFYVYLALLYFGFSLLGNIFPLLEDALLLKERAFDRGKEVGKPTKIFLALPTSFMLIGAYLEQYVLNLLVLILLFLLVFIF
ncbi:MAG: hypothetical protein GX345_05645 [Clostridiales bacterium]|nr:hypothetical protein [Clostridiales bacterium]